MDYEVFGDEPEWFRALFLLVDQPYPSVEWMNDIELQNLKKVRSDSFAVELAEKVVVNGDEYANCMLVDCDVKISPGKGYGLFAKHNIPKGTVLFREEDVIEKDMDKIKVISWLQSLPEKQQKRVLHHSYVNNDRFIWCRSVHAFANHSRLHPNHVLVEGSVEIGGKSGLWKATKNIKKGEELLYDYGVLGVVDPQWF